MAEGFRSMEIGEYDLYTAGAEGQVSRLTLDDWKHPNITPDWPNLQLEEEDIYTAGDERPKPSAPLDIGKLIIKVDWTGPFPERWRARLQIALQTWLSRMEENAFVHSVKPMDDKSCAEVQITPSAALESLKKLESIRLKFKNENKEVIAWICQDEASSVTVPQMSMLEENGAPSPKVDHAVPGTSTEAKDITSSDRSPNMTETSSSFTLPLHLSWYMHNAYRNELEQIGKRHGVFICPQVSISIQPAENSSPDCVSKAYEDCRKLVEGCVDGVRDATIDHDDMDLDFVKETLRSIKSQKTKLMFTLTDSNGLFLGPKKYTDMIIEEQRARMKSQINDCGSPQSKPSLDLPTHLEVDNVYWDLMKLSYKEQLSQLEFKYGVSFIEEKSKRSLIKVQAQSREVQRINLERHAIRALTQLYQKLAFAAVTCELRSPADQTVVAALVEKLQQRYCVVTVNGLKSWKLAGLPEHLGPAIAEIEKTLRRKVFNEKMKRSIGYSEDISHTRGIRLNQMPDYGAGAVGGTEWDDGVNWISLGNFSKF